MKLIHYSTQCFWIPTGTGLPVKYKQPVPGNSKREFSRKHDVREHGSCWMPDGPMELEGIVSFVYFRSLVLSSICLPISRFRERSFIVVLDFIVSSQAFQTSETFDSSGSSSQEKRQNPSEVDQALRTFDSSQDNSTLLDGSNQAKTKSLHSSRV